MKKRVHNRKKITARKKAIKEKNILKLFNKTILLIAFFVSYSIYLFWRFYYTIPKSYGYASLIAGYLLFFAEAIGFIESSMFYLTLWDTDTPSTPEVDNKDFPHVDIFIATYNESNDLLYKTLAGCKNMNYPDKNKVHIYLCDDGNRNAVKELCKKLEVGYITRSDNSYAKAGNLNNALAQTSSPYIVTFDADMIPMHDFLLKTIPFFIAEEKIGFVQVPQNFYNPDLFQYNLFTEKNIPNEQSLFSRLVQAGKSRFNAIIYAGSNTVLSREALNEIGGLVVGTITEDFATGMKIQSNGYKCICLNEVHASGLSPESLQDLFNQRIRWGRGVIQTFKMFNPLFMKGLNIFQKIMYFSAFSYWYFGLWRFVFLMAPVLFSTFGIIILSTSAIQMLQIWLPMFIFTNLTFLYFSKGIRTVLWSHVYDTILFPHITKGVLKETFGFKMSKFEVTPKENIKRTNFINRFELVKVQIVIAILSLIGIIRITYLWITNNFETQYIINLFWLSYNFYTLAMAIFFASERPKFRNNERLFITENAYITKDKQIFHGKTLDISETGISIILEKPIYLDLNENHNIKVETNRNHCDFLANIVRVDNFNKKYKYVFNISEIDEENFCQLLLILYDRVPPFPEKEHKDYIINNIIKNIKNRKKEISTLNRRLPRISVNKTLKIMTKQNEDFIHIIDFNYMYIAIKKDKNYMDFLIPLDDKLNINLHCVFNKKLSPRSRKDILVYKIVNYNEFLNHDIVSLLNLNAVNTDELKLSSPKVNDNMYLSS